MILTVWPRWTRSTYGDPWVKSVQLLLSSTQDISELTNLDSLITPSKEIFSNILKLQTLWKLENQRLLHIMNKLHLINLDKIAIQIWIFEIQKGRVWQFGEE